MFETIENEWISLSVFTLGAQMKSVKNKAGEEMLWTPKPDYWQWYAPLLFPWAGPVKDGKYTYEGKEYEARVHGFARDFVFDVICHEQSKLVLQLNANEDTKKLYPFDFSLTVTFTLEGETVHHAVSVKNNGEKPMKFGLGYHPGVRVPFDSAHKTDDYEIRFEQFENPLVLGTAPGGLMNGTVHYLGKNMKAFPLYDGMFDQKGSHCICNLASDTISICEKDSGRKISYDIAKFPYVLFWSNNTPAERELGFICIEPWHSIPSSVGDTGEWEDKAAAACLAKGEVFDTVLSITFAR